MTIDACAGRCERRHDRGGRPSGRAGWRAVGWALVAGLTLVASGDVSAIRQTRDAGARPTAYARVCPDLPPARPADLVVRYAIHDYERPEALARWALVSEVQACPADEVPRSLGYAPEHCVRLDAAGFDALYAELRRAGVDRIRVRSLPRWPHWGGTEIDLRWADVRCRVGDVTHDIEPAPADRDKYRAADSVLRDAIHAALQ
jgi:hypothetical protein